MVISNLYFLFSIKKNLLSLVNLSSACLKLLGSFWSKNQWFFACNRTLVVRDYQKLPKKLTYREIQTRFYRKATGFTSPTEMSIKHSLFFVDFQVSETLILAYVLKKWLSKFSRNANPKDIFGYSISHVTEIAALIPTNKVTVKGLTFVKNLSSEKIVILSLPREC